LDIKDKCQKYETGKTILTYLALTVTAVLVDNIYALFGHGVRSAAMTWMFLYPLLGGALFYFFIGIIIPGISHAAGYRLFYNVYNSGIAILTVGSFLKGILDIAGTSSPYILLFYMTACLFIAAGLTLLAFPVLYCLKKEVLSKNSFTNNHQHIPNSN
jgi:hypothetical protein